MFYKRRDYSTVIDGRNPIVAHEFLGEHLDGKMRSIIDDMISSGEVCWMLQNRLKPAEQTGYLSAPHSDSLPMVLKNLMIIMKKVHRPRDHY